MKSQYSLGIVPTLFVMLFGIMFATYMFTGSSPLFLTIASCFGADSGSSCGLSGGNVFVIVGGIIVFLTGTSLLSASPLSPFPNPYAYFAPLAAGFLALGVLPTQLITSDLGLPIGIRVFLIAIFEFFIVIGTAQWLRGS